MIYGPDAHAKNYSLLLAGATVRLAPLYDISSVLPYPDRYDLRTMTMAIIGKYQNSLVTGDDWRALARAAEVDPDEMTGWVYDVLSNAPDALADVVREEAGWITELEMTRHLVDGVAAASKQLLRRIEPPATGGGSDVAAVARRPGKPRVASYRKSDGTWVSGYDNPRYRG